MRDDVDRSSACHLKCYLERLLALEDVLLLVPLLLDAELVGPCATLATGDVEAEWSPTVDLNALEDTIDGRNDDKRHDGGNNETADDGDTHWTPHL